MQVLFQVPPFNTWLDCYSHLGARKVVFILHKTHALHNSKALAVFKDSAETL